MRCSGCSVITGLLLCVLWSSTRQEGTCALVEVPLVDPEEETDALPSATFYQETLESTASSENTVHKSATMGEDSSTTASFNGITQEGPDKVFIFGDIHGDAPVLELLLKTTNVTSAQGHWMNAPQKTGESVWLVQMGDIVDRGAHSAPAYRTLQKLRREASRVGDRVLQLMGNHELFVMCGVYAYMNPEDLRNSFNNSQDKVRQEFSRDGWIGSDIRKNFEIAFRINDTVFVHAGFEEAYARVPFDNLKKEVISCVDDHGCRGQGMLGGILGDTGPLWTRKAAQGDCNLLEKTLEILDAERLVVGHTPTAEGAVTLKCHNRLVMVDVGLSRWMHGSPRVVRVSKPENEMPFSKWNWHEMHLHIVDQRTFYFTERLLGCPGVDVSQGAGVTEDQRDEL